MASGCRASRGGPISLVTRRLARALNIERNGDYLALAEEDHFSNLAGIRGIRLNLHGKERGAGESNFCSSAEQDRPGLVLH
ncbi:hypothetical protein MPNT_40176 [Candidatus Methylacidithermus pantelleriae]|uniref:Uncharacterized protein n=1 Tax=Candidatus Methylacidithermus pantelleriae TaxID=2744239 RepID=A0A8J2BRD7_9BACT|nr:hypothetical protein MPNT_40176 [Candidatus Methylacidithermus pantelleriae]